MKSPMGLRIPPLRIMLESNPLKSTMLVGRLGVVVPPKDRHIQSLPTVLLIRGARVEHKALYGDVIIISPTRCLLFVQKLSHGDLTILSPTIISTKPWNVNKSVSEFTSLARSNFQKSRICYSESRVGKVVAESPHTMLYYTIIHIYIYMYICIYAYIYIYIYTYNTD